jgi:hypothetical protein
MLFFNLLISRKWQMLKKHAFYTVIIFPIFLVKNLQNSKKIYTTKKSMGWGDCFFTMSSSGYCCGLWNTFI